MNLKFNGKTYNVLIADDDDVTMQLMTYIVSSLGIGFDFVDNGLDAVLYSKNNDYDLIFMDIVMPKLTGIQAIEHIRQYNKNIPIVVMTGDEKVKQKIKYNKIYYLLKPFEIEQVYEIITNILSNSKIEIPENFEGNEDVYYQLLKVFIKDVQDRLNSILDAYELKDWNIIERESHSLKGSAGYVSADGILKKAIYLNEKIKNEDFYRIDEVIDSLNKAISNFIEKTTSSIAL